MSIGMWLGYLIVLLLRNYYKMQIHSFRAASHPAITLAFSIAETNRSGYVTTKGTSCIPELRHLAA